MQPLLTEPRPSGSAPRISATCFVGPCEHDSTPPPTLGGCFDQTDYALSYTDDSGNYDDVEDALEDVGCTGGHKVCTLSCAFGAEHPVQPKAPQFETELWDLCPNGIDAQDGGLYWEEFSESTTQGAYCDPEDDCWNDVNTNNAAGNSTTWEWYCNCGLEATPKPVSPRRHQ